MKKLTFIIVLLVFAGCTQKKNNVKSKTAVISGVDVSSQCSGVTSNNVGTIYDTSTNMFDFTNRVKALLSVNISPDNVGTVSSMEADSTGIRFKGKVKIDANGNVVSNESQVQISVYDSIWLNNRYTNPNEQEIKIDFNPSQGRGATITGQFNTSSGQGFILLKDNYGEIRFEGVIDAQRLSGRVSFQNSVTVIANSQPLSGVLGQFYIQRCDFLK